MNIDCHHGTTLYSNVNIALAITSAEIPLGFVVFLTDRYQTVSSIGKCKSIRIQVGIYIGIGVAIRGFIAINETERSVGVEHSPTNGTAIAASRTVEDFGLDAGAITAHILTIQHKNFFRHGSFLLRLDADDCVKTSREACGRAGIAHTSPTAEIGNKWIQDTHVEPAVASAAPAPVDVEEACAGLIAVSNV